MLANHVTALLSPRSIGGPAPSTFPKTLHNPTFLARRG
jgi:hypothetical protein